MEALVIGLALMSIVLFSITLYMATRLPSQAPIKKSAAPVHVHHNNSLIDAKAIVVQLPQEIALNKVCDVLMRVSLCKCQDRPDPEKNSQAGERKARFNRSLDEYF